jgi:hypothetical protein
MVRFPVADVLATLYVVGMTPKYLMIDGMFSGTGIRDAVEGGYHDPMTLGLSPLLIGDLQAWLIRYEEAHYLGFVGADTASCLDAEGLALAHRLASELPGTKVGYFSDAQASVLKQVI